MIHRRTVFVGALLSVAGSFGCESSNFGAGARNSIQAHATPDKGGPGSGDTPGSGAPGDKTGSPPESVKLAVGGSKNLTDEASKGTPADPAAGDGSGGDGTATGSGPGTMHVASCKVDDPKIAACDAKTGIVKGLAPGKTIVHLQTLSDVKKDFTVVVSGPGLTPGTDTSASGVGTASNENGPGGPDNGGNPGSNAQSSGTASVDQGSNGTGPGELASEDGQKIADIPGVEVLKVGVNFEDRGPSGDRDYNDAVLCFQGKFKVDNANVVSTAEQTVTGSTYSHSGCRHHVRVEITHADGSKESPIQFDSRDKTPLTLHFKVGTRLEAFMQTYNGKCDRSEHTMHEADWARVQPDLCNTEGH